MIFAGLLALVLLVARAVYAPTKLETWEEEGQPTRRSSSL